MNSCPHAVLIINHISDIACDIVLLHFLVFVIPLVTAIGSSVIRDCWLIRELSWNYIDLYFLGKGRDLEDLGGTPRHYSSSRVKIKNFPINPEN